MSKSDSLFSVRPFGLAEDLDLEFERTDRPTLVTALLARCSATGDPDAWWKRPVGTRVAALLQVVALSEESDMFPVRLSCPEPACGETLEVTLSIDALTSEPVMSPSPRGSTSGAAGTTPIELTLPDGCPVAVRRPTGADQRQWGHRAYTSRREAIAVMIDTLLIAGRVPAGDESAIATVGEALADEDPLAAFSVSCTCPACSRTNELAVDLERTALDRLAARQRTLIQDVHVLASRYGWTEAEILAIPPGRRTRYRMLIDEVWR